MEKILGPIVAWAMHTIKTLGYPGIVLLMAIESACIPLPSEVIMPFSGALCGMALAAAQTPPMQAFNLHVVSFAGALPFAPSLDTVGFFTRTARQMQWLWEQIGFGCSPAIASPSVATWDHPPADLVAAAYTVNRYEGARTHQARYREFGDRLGVRLAALIRQGLETPESEYRAARTLIAQRREQVFAQADFILSPAATGPAPAGFETTGDPAMNAPWTALGSPAITVPRRAFPPIGLQIAAAPGKDAELLAFAVELEATM